MQKFITNIKTKPEGTQAYISSKHALREAKFESSKILNIKRNERRN